MTDESKKLKRGLEDISPLFRKMMEKKEAETAVIKEDLPAARSFSRIQCLSVFCPDLPSDTLFFNSYLASSLAERNQECAVVSLQDGPVGSSDQANPAPLAPAFQNRLKYASFSWRDFQKACAEERNMAAPEKNLERMIFLDSNIYRSPYATVMISLLDKLILLVQPNMESISECYKLIKATLKVNPRMEYLMMYDGIPTDSRGSLLFEKLSALISRHLGVDLIWLGCLHFGKHRGEIIAEIISENLLLQSVHARGSIEKCTLSRMVFYSGENIGATNAVSAP